MRLDDESPFWNRHDDCPFCDIITGKTEATIVADGISNIGIVPSDPVADGHFLVVPKVHIDDAYENPSIAGTTMNDAATWAKIFSDRDPRYKSVDIFTSVGRLANQVVRHMHIHVVPCTQSDDLSLPWTSRQEKNR